MNAPLTFNSDYVETVPDHIPSELVHDFDHFDPVKSSKDPFKPFLDLQATAPDIFYSRNHGGFWVAQKYDTQKYILQTPKLFSSWPMNIPYVPAWPRKLLPVELDPPEHKKYRGMLAPLFTPKAVTLIEPMIRQACEELVDGFTDSSEIEFLKDFARPFPTNTFLSLMGLPLSDAEKLLDIEDRIMHPSYSAEIKMQAGIDIMAYMTEGLAKTRKQPQDSDKLLSHISYWKDKEGNALSDEEILDIGFLMFMAGLDTVTSLFGFSFAHLANNHQLQQQLIKNLDDPKALDSAIDELLRKFPSVNTNRTVLEDCEIDGITLKRGDRIMLPIVLANHDPSKFKCPHQVDLTRKDNEQMLFGHGPHKCIGQHLGRLELRIALETILRRKPYFSIPADKEISTYGGGVMGTLSLPLCWK